MMTLIVQAAPEYMRHVVPTLTYRWPDPREGYQCETLDPNSPHCVLSFASRQRELQVLRKRAAPPRQLPYRFRRIAGRGMTMAEKIWRELAAEAAPVWVVRRRHKLTGEEFLSTTAAAVDAAVLQLYIGQDGEQWVKRGPVQPVVRDAPEPRGER